MIDKPETPRWYESHIHSEYGVWSRRLLTGLIIVNIFLTFVLVGRVDRNYSGNPNSGGRQLVCVTAKDDAERDAEVYEVVRDNCPGLHLPTTTLP